MTESGMKSAYEIALERLEQRGIEKPSSATLSEETRAGVAEIRNKARAELANLENFHRDRMAKHDDPADRLQEEQAYLSERGRIESRRERDVKKLRER